MKKTKEVFMFNLKNMLVGSLLFFIFSLNAFAVDSVIVASMQKQVAVKTETRRLICPKSFHLGFYIRASVGAASPYQLEMNAAGVVRLAYQFRNRTMTYTVRPSAGCMVQTTY